MKVIEQHIKGVYLIEPDVFSDDRGSFFRSFCAEELKDLEIGNWVQMNHSYNTKKGTLRGMHYQLPPHGETKQIRCVKGSVYDVFVDVRPNSKTYLQWGAVELSETNRNSLILKEGIAHGFITLEDDSQLIYHHAAFYTPGSEAGIRYNDPEIGIKWPLEPNVISERDLNHPLIDKNFKGFTS